MQLDAGLAKAVDGPFEIPDRPGDTVDWRGRGGLCMAPFLLLGRAPTLVDHRDRPRQLLAGRVDPESLVHAAETRRRVEPEPGRRDECGQTHPVLASSEPTRREDREDDRERRSQETIPTADVSFGHTILSVPVGLALSPRARLRPGTYESLGRGVFVSR